MPERQIPWRQAAQRLSGSFQVKTGVASTRFELQAVVDGIAVKVSAKSSPYRSTGDHTEVHALTEQALGVTIYLGRNVGSVPVVRRFFLRDVLIGELGFDHEWIINARREAHAQAFLSPEVCSLIQQVPSWTSSANHLGEFTSRYYKFDVRGRGVMAYTDNFETNPDRLFAAIGAAVALAKQPKALLTRWKQLASDLDGRLEHGAHFRMDGSTRIHFPLQGARIIVSPMIVRLTRRRDRLRTRVSCECYGSERQEKFHFVAGESTQFLGEHRVLVEKAMIDSGVQVLQGNGKLVHADLDGNVTDEARVIAAASAVAILSRGTEGLAGPYR